MKKFNFNLQKLLEIRQREEDNIKNEMSVYVQAYNKVNNNIEQFKNTMQNYRSRKLELFSNPGGIGMYTDGVRYFREGIEHLNNELVEKEKNLNIWKKKLLEAVKRKKAIEYIKQKAYENYKKEQKKQEQKIIDEVSQMATTLEMKF